MLKTDQQIRKLIDLNVELENYFRNTIIPQLFVDADLILRKFTPPAMKQFDLSAADIGRSLYDTVNNFRFPTIIENVQQVIYSNEILEKEIQTTDFRWYQMNILPYISSVDNKANGVIITFVEITRRIKDLKDQERLISDHETLLDTISHDIKTPLSSLLLAVEMIKDVSPENSEEFKPLLKVVENAINKMHVIISELTDTRRIEHKYKAEEELLNFEHILEDVRLTLSDNMIKFNASIRSEVNVSEITFSRRKLRSILYNLVSNAIKYKSPGRKAEIFIKTTRENDLIIISVKDNGIGIEPDKQEAIFSKYFRVDNAIEGSGIGLYLVKEIVNSSGGKILVESRPGHGSEFKVYLKTGLN